jgi:hypothetical protein
MSQTPRSAVSQPAQKEDDLESLLVGILGIALVIVATGAAYYFISNSAPRSIDDASTSNIHTAVWIGGIFGSFFFIYGVIGVLRGKMGVGWGPSYARASTVLTGAGAFEASVATSLGGVLFMVAALIDLVPEVGIFIHGLAILLSGFVAILLGWLCGVIIRGVGY